MGNTLAAEIGLDGSGRLLDVGCGPGTLTFELASRFEEAVGVDPDLEMLAEAARQAAQRRIGKVRWIKGLADDLRDMGLGAFRVVTFGQSFQWTERERVAEVVYELLEPGGALVLVAHELNDRPQPVGPGHPPIPYEAIEALIEHFLGPRRRAGQGFASQPPDRHEDALARTRFGTPRIVFCDGRPDIVQDIDGVIARYLSTSYAAPHLFGQHLEEFLREARAELAEQSPSGLFWDWPGDTALVIGRKGAGIQAGSTAPDNPLHPTAGDIRP